MSDNPWLILDGFERANVMKRYDRLKVFVGDELWAYLKPRDIEDLRMKGEYRKRINPKDNSEEKIFIWDKGAEK